MTIGWHMSEKGEEVGQKSLLERKIKVANLYILLYQLSHHQPMRHHAGLGPFCQHTSLSQDLCHALTPQLFSTPKCCKPHVIIDATALQHCITIPIHEKYIIKE